MDWVVFGVQWLHVLLGIFWFGNAIAVAVILIPAISALPIPTQRQVGSRYADIAERTFKVVAPTVIALGIIRGTVLGPIRSLDFDWGRRMGSRGSSPWSLRSPHCCGDSM